jgi:hypothetical protein
VATLADVRRWDPAAVLTARAGPGAADTITDLHRELAMVDGLAAARGYRITSDGTVVAPPTAPGTAPRTARLQAAELAEIATSIAGLLRRAEALEAAGDAIPTPEQNARRWAALTPAQRDSVLRTDPDLVGGRDGVPADARDAANRARLGTRTDRTDTAIATVRARLAEVPAPSGQQRAALEYQLAELEDQRDALTAVADTLAADPAGRRLLLLDVDGHAEPHAAVAVGDIGTADHVVVHTPGATVTVTDSLPAVTHDLTALREQAHTQLARAGRAGEAVAAVAWLGYDLPDARAARAAGADLARFLDGVGAARPDAPHLTALGHAHGATVTGYALRLATGVDEAVLLSQSPDDGDHLTPRSTGQYNLAATVAGLPENRIGTADGPVR